MLKYYKYFALLVLPILCGIIIIAHFSFPTPNFDNEDTLFEYARFKQKNKGACLSYIELMQIDSNHARYIYHFAREWATINKKQQTLLSYEWQKQGISPFQRYNFHVENEDLYLNNVGHFGKAAIYYFEDNFYFANHHLDSISDENFPGRHLLLGLIDERQGKINSSFNHYLKERKNEELKIESTLLIYKHLFYNEDYEKTKILLKSLTIRKHIPPFYERIVYFKSREYLNYFATIHQHVKRNMDITGIMAAFFVMLIWLFYVLRISRLSKSNKTIIFLSIFFSFGCLYPVLLVYDIFDIVFGFSINNSFINDFFYNIFGIGLIEELAKLIPVVLTIFIFKKKITNPMDYLLIGCGSAIGFSFIENIIYFTGDRLYVISGRTMISVVLHLLCTSFAVYGLIIIKFNETTRKNIFKGLQYIAAAIITHGMFDLWLTSGSMNGGEYMAFLVMFIGIYYWVKIINKCLNNSDAYNNREIVNIDRLNFLLLTLLSSSICLEYLSFIYVQGPDDGLHILKYSIFSGVFFIPYLSYRLSRIDIAPPGNYVIDIYANNKAYKLNQVLSQKAVIKPLKSFGEIIKILPSSGEIVQRVCIKNDCDWFQFKPDQELFINSKEIEFLLVKPKNVSEKITAKNVVVQVRLQFLDQKPENQRIYPFLDWGMINIKSSL